MISEAKIENFNHNPLPFRKAFFSPGKNCSVLNKLTQFI